MLKDLFQHFKGRATRLRRTRATPLVSAQHDIALLQRVRGKRLPGKSQIRHATALMKPVERVVFRLATIVFACAFVWLVYLILAQYSVAVPRVGGTYTEAVVGHPERVNPLYAQLNDADMDVTRLVYSGLMRVDTKQRLVPDLAASYEISEDKKVYTFTLRDNIRWHDGEPFTAQDVLYTFETILNKDVASPLMLTFQGVRVEAPDEKTIRFTLSEPFAPFLSSLTVGILPAHIWENFTPEQILTTQRNLQPIGTGPFAFVRFTKDKVGNIAKFELKRFEDYYRQPPYLKEFIFEFFNSYDGDDGAVTAIREQSVDALHFVPSDLRERVERKHITLNTMQLPEYTALFYNQNGDSALKSKTVRQALAYAVDKDRLLHETLDGEGQVIYSPVLPGSLGYIADIEKTPYDIGQANTLLDTDWPRVSAQDYAASRREQMVKEAIALLGTASSTDGTTTTQELSPETQAAIDARLKDELSEAQTFYRKSKSGELLELKIVTTDVAEYRAVAERIAGFWQDIGVKVQLTYVTPDSFSRDILRGRMYDVLLYGVIVGSDPDQYPFWHSSQVQYPGLNLSGFVNANVDAALKEAREAKDDASATAAYVKFQQQLLPEYPALFLYMPTYTYATTGNVQGQELSGIFVPSDRFAGVINWYKKTRKSWQF